MNGRDQEPHDEKGDPPLRAPACLASRLSVVFCVAALVVTFIRLIEFDAPLTRFVRSLNEFQIDYLHNPWLRSLSDIGNQVGRGESLFLVSVLLLAVGYTCGVGTWKSAGWGTLVSHALAGVINNALKHLVGRARPKFMHAGISEFAPLAGNGWDSFPSGHATSAFAVATVIAVRFPKIRWIVILLATAISASRLFRASHYLTDIAGGAVLGTLIGSLVAHPWKEWRSSLASALFAVTPPLAIILAVLTAIGQPFATDGIGNLLRASGFCIALVAITVYGVMIVRPAFLPGALIRAVILALIGLGLGIFSESVWVATVMLLLGLAHWLRVNSIERTVRPISPSSWTHEAALGLTVLLMLYTVIELRGALPTG